MEAALSDACSTEERILQDAYRQLPTSSEQKEIDFHNPRELRPAGHGLLRVRARVLEQEAVQCRFARVATMSWNGWP